MFCNKCGRTSASTVCTLCSGNSKAVAHPRSRSDKRVVQRSPNKHNYLGFTITLSCIVLLIIVIKESSRPHPERNETKKSDVASDFDDTAASIPTKTTKKKTLGAELFISDFMLHPRSKLETVLGKPIDSGECIDTKGIQYDYADESYACVRNQKVVLLSYRVKTPVRSPEELLQVVGLMSFTKPIDLGVEYGWFAERGNPIRIEGIEAKKVIVGVERFGNISIDMSDAIIK